MHAVVHHCIKGDIPFQWRDFITFSGTKLGLDPQPIFTQNGLIDVDSRKDVPFAVKIETFSNPRPRPRNRANLTNVRIWKISAKNRPL